MLEDYSYRKKTVVDIDAAVIGVSRLRWRSVTAQEAADGEAARTIMAEHGFDVLPVDDANREVRAYIMTKRWGDYSEVEQRGIEYEDVIPQRTPLYDVIRRFAEKNRHHYFLAHEGVVTGLITVVNLNCRQTRTLLFSLLSELEVRLGQLVQGHVGHDLHPDEILAEAKADVRERFEADRRNQLHRDPVEYLYLTDLLKIIRKRGWYIILGYESATSFKAEFNKLPALRNAVAHPGSPMIRDPEGAANLWRDIQVIERALFQLQRHERDAA